MQEHGRLVARELNNRQEWPKDATAWWSKSQRLMLKKRLSFERGTGGRGETWVLREGGPWWGEGGELSAGGPRWGDGGLV